MKRRILLLSRKRGCLHIALRGRFSGAVTTHFVNKPLAAEAISETGSYARSFLVSLDHSHALLMAHFKLHRPFLLSLKAASLRFWSSKSPPSRLISFLISN